ncbi:hypothetical protein Tco_0299941 [Tanacetum coccineum]
MDDPNITMEEYIRLEEEKARKCGKVFNWETARYGKIWYDEDVHDLKSVENGLPAIVFNDNLTSNEIPSCEPAVGSLNNNEIDFRISFDESDDEDYTIEDNDNFEMKGQFLKELRDNTFSSSDHEDVNEQIKKVLEIVDLFHIPNITIDQVMLRAFHMSLTGGASC